MPRIDVVDEAVIGKTRVHYRWNVRPKRRLFFLFSAFMDIGKIHSDVIQKGFKALNGYLTKK
jgi:hypothetical protein